MEERRKILAHLKGQPFAFRRFTVIAPLINGAAYGTEMVERRKLPDRRRNHEAIKEYGHLYDMTDKSEELFKLLDGDEYVIEKDGKRYTGIKGQELPCVPGVGATKVCAFTNKGIIAIRDDENGTPISWVSKDGKWERLEV